MTSGGILDKARWIELRAERSQARGEHRLEDAKEISKEISKIIRCINRQRYRARVQTILQEFRGLKYVKSMKNNARKHHIAAD